MTISDENKFIDVNESYSKLTGYSRDELIGHNTAELNILDVNEREQYLNKSKEDGLINDIEFEMKTKFNRKEKPKFLQIQFGIPQASLHSAQLPRPSSSVFRFQLRGLWLPLPFP